MQLQVINCRDEDGSDRREFGDGRKSIEVVDTRYLRETLGNKASLVADDLPSSILLGIFARKTHLELTILAPVGTSLSSQVPALRRTPDSSWIAFSQSGQSGRHFTSANDLGSNAFHPTYLRCHHVLLCEIGGHHPISHSLHFRRRNRCWRYLDTGDGRVDFTPGS